MKRREVRFDGSEGGAENEERMVRVVMSSVKRRGRRDKVMKKNGKNCRILWPEFGFFYNQNKEITIIITLFI